jgi:hypothetical protein
MGSEWAACECAPGRAAHDGGVPSGRQTAARASVDSEQRHACAQTGRQTGWRTGEAMAGCMGPLAAGAGRAQPVAPREDAAVLQAYPTRPGRRMAGRAGVSLHPTEVKAPTRPAPLEAPRPPRRTEAHPPPAPPGFTYQQAQPAPASCSRSPPQPASPCTRRPSPAVRRRSLQLSTALLSSALPYARSQRNRRFLAVVPAARSRLPKQAAHTASPAPTPVLAT